MKPAAAAGRHRVSTHVSAELGGAWSFVGTEPDAADSPAALAKLAGQLGLERLAMRAGDTIGAALEDLGLLSLDAPPDLDGRDWWVQCEFASALPGGAPAFLVFEGLATIVDVWLNDEWLGRTDDMFVAWECDVTALLRDANRLVLGARAMSTRLAPRRPRARWRSHLVRSQEWRWHRTSMIGRMPGFGPQVPIVGAWRPVRLERRPDARVRSLDIAATWANGTSTLGLHASLALDVAPDSAQLVCAAHRADAVVERDEDGEGWRVRGALSSESIAPWRPYTHGTPAQHECALILDCAGTSVVVELGPIGFRSVTLDATHGAFAMTVNGARPFLRGSCWIPRDWLRPDLDAGAIERECMLLREAGINCIRLSGCFTYASPALLAACDRYGIMVWHDLMFSLLDYPSDDASFSATCDSEVAQRAALLQSSASTLVVCGSSEVDQQAAMMGVPLDAARHPLFHDALGRVVRRVLPLVPYWPSTPGGDGLPFRTDAGTAHYFGVGAYERPLDDARRASVRFTTECLAFANLPEPESPAALVLDDAGQGLARWKARVPRDGGADWDFEDTRDFYVASLFGADPARLRAEQPERYLALGRAATAIAIERTMQEFRRSGSPCQGAITWLWSDPWRGAGWGAVDASGRPKSAWYALRRALRPVAVALTDEGMNGVDVHLWNDAPDPIEGTLILRLMVDGARTLHVASRAVAVDGGGSVTLTVDELFKRFVDASHAYAFGPRTHDVVHAVWVRGDGASASPDDARFEDRAAIDDAVLLIGGDARPLEDTGLRARIAARAESGDLVLAVTAGSFAQAVRVGGAAYRASDSYFPLVSGMERLVRLELLDASADRSIVVEALNDPTVLRLEDPGQVRLER